ncbi:MAG: AIR carboxylase family protein [Deltaproteobacteria bacterium]|nr:AIR carboxylase family protein [Deltaproteobacteria bacterium]
MLFYFETPQLMKVHSGKVRESFRVNDRYRILVATDRLSCFDEVLPTSFAGKGVVLTQMAAEWFERTKHLVASHFVKTVAPNVCLVREAKPIPVEMIVRQYLTGSLWRKYEKGEREMSGVRLPDGMVKNQRFPRPILTPTTKETSDRPISPEELVKVGWVDRQTYGEMEEAALKVFRFGQEYCESRGLSLVDTKYEFGWIDGKLALIDELHTPDSSRFWPWRGERSSSDELPYLDKEFIRQWLLSHPEAGNKLAPDVCAEAKRRYELVLCQLFDRQVSEESEEDLSTRTYRSLVAHRLIKPAYIAIVMGSRSDLAFAESIRERLAPYDVMVDMRVVSAHKNGECIEKLAQEYNHSIEPGCVIAVAGRSNGLGGALAANLNIPVINCPPFKDAQDLQMNINSSLMMPSHAPALTAVFLEQAVSAALRVLNVPSLRRRMIEEIKMMKQTLKDDDASVRASFRKDSFEIVGGAK